MAEYSLVEERLISGSGVLKNKNGKKFRSLILYLDVIREPTNKYLNKNWNPSRSKYAFLTFLRKDYVIAEAAMEFPKQAYDGINDISSQNLIAIKCAYEGILISLANISVGLNLVITQYTDLIKDYEYLSNSWDEVRIKCYGSTAIQARLFVLLHDTCNENKDKENEPPPPPPPRTPVPPTTPISDLSQPYDEDDDVTDPYDGDEFPPPDPVYEDCTILIVKVTFTLPSFGMLERQHRVFAPCGEVRVNPTSAFAYEAFCKGNAGGTCQATQGWVGLNSTSEPISNFTLVSILPE